ncbi:MAG: helix-turn-helix domain-containing protein [Xanthobacteraceae bacterium]|nr:helix-turn-helix domain-containing protein [Xanthobacteraceae bacterium]
MRSRSPHQRQQELGDFVRAQREKLDPAAVGVPAGGRRRTPGLRREEVAQLCGLSVTWYTWLEQGRQISLSPTALARLAAALRLDRAQRDYLFELAGKRDPHEDDVAIDELPAPVKACIKVIRAPAYVLDRTWTARAWNIGAERLFVGWLTPAGERNLLRFIFLEPTARSLISDYEERAHRVVAEFRADVSTHLDDASIRSLVDELRSESKLFARLWGEHSVLGREGGARTFNHPTRGHLRYEQVTFNVASRPDLKLVMLIQQKAQAGSGIIS